MAKVLVVDDSGLIRMRTANALKNMKHQVIQAQDGEAAVRLYDQERPDAVFMDINMPKMNGNIALTEILKLDPQAKVIIMTSERQPIVSLRSRHFGAKDFLVKPCGSLEILLALDKVLR